MGWNAGDDKEFYASLDEMAEAFSLERINKSAAVFDLDKLTHINFLHLREMPADQLAAELSPYFEAAGISQPDGEKMTAIIEVMRERAQVYPDYVEGCRYFYEAPTEYEAGTVKKRWKEDSPVLLKAYRDKLAECEWTLEAMEAGLRAVTEEAGAGAGRLIHPVRLAVSGVGGGPGLFELLHIVGREECLRRIDHALENITV